MCYGLKLRHLMVKHFVSYLHLWVYVIYFFWHHNIIFYNLNLNLRSLSPFKEMQVDKELKTRATQKVPPLFLVTIIGGFEIVLCKCFVWRVRNHFLFEAQLLLKIISCLRSWGPQFVKHPLLFFTSTLSFHILFHFSL